MPDVEHKEPKMRAHMWERPLREDEKPAPDPTPIVVPTPAHVED